MNPFSSIIQDIKILQISESTTEINELYPKILKSFDQIYDQILSKAIKLPTESLNQEACDQIITLINLQFPKRIICNNYSYLNKTLITLSNSMKIQYVKFRVDLTPFFLQCCYHSIPETKDSFTLRQNFSNFLNLLFSNIDFSFKFFNHSLYQSFFTNVLPKCKEFNFLYWIFNLIINEPHKNSFKNEDLDSIFNSIQTLFENAKLEKGLTEIFFFSISKLFYRLSSINETCSDSFLKNKIPYLIDKNTRPEKWKEIFSILLSSNSNVNVPPPNSGILKFLLNLYINDDSDYKKKFIIKKIETYKIYSTFENYFDSFQDMLNFLKILGNDIKKYEINFFELLIQCILKAFTNQLIDDPLLFSQFFSIIKDTKIDIDKNPLNFMRCFIQTPSKTTLQQLFDNGQFQETVLHLFSLLNFKDNQPTTFPYIFDLNDRDNMHKVLAEFIKSNPSKRLIRSLMNCILANPIQNGFLIIIFAMDDLAFCEKFVHCDGLQFLDNCLKSGHLSLHFFSTILSTIVSHHFFEEVEEFISNLDDDHPLFKMNPKHLESIVYGENCNRFRPIRIPSLFYYLQDKEKVDPYNSYLLGRFGLRQFLKKGYDIYSVPFITDISNRYLKSEDVDYMIRNPVDFSKFCDNTNFDHFSLFLLYPNQDELEFSGDFNAISFWVRFDYIQQKQVNYFFSDGNVFLSVNQNVINLELQLEKIDMLFNISNSSKTVSMKNKFRWNHFFILTEDDRKHTKKTVFVNGKNILSCSVPLASKDGNHKVFFYNYEQKLMFIGPAIRFFSLQALNSPFNLPEEIFAKGPKYINYLSNKHGQTSAKNLTSNGSIDQKLIIKELKITPFNLSRKALEIKKKVPQNCYTVPYFGFPFHFLSNRRLSFLFKSLDSANDENTFNAIIRTLFSIMSIIEIDPDLFFRQLLNSMMMNKQFFSKSLFIQSLHCAFGQQPSITILRSIFFDKDMWEKVDPNLLLDVLFSDYLETSDFSNFPDCELFLLGVIRKHPECIENVLNNTEKVPKLSKLILETLFYKKKKIVIQIAIADACLKIIMKSSILNEQSILKKIKEYLIISDKPLRARLFRIMKTISIKKKEAFPLTNSILYSIMQLVSYCTVWEDVFELLQTFGNVYISLLFGLVWSCSYGELFIATFNNKAIEKTHLYDSDHILYLIENTESILNDKLCTHLIGNFYPILCNITEFEIGGLKTEQMDEFTHSILGCFNSQIPKYFTYKPDITKKYFLDLPLVHLYNSLLKGCKSEAKFKFIYFSLFVGCPFYNISMYSEYSPTLLIAFLSNYSEFVYSSLFFKYLLFPVSQKIFTNSQIEDLLNLIFQFCSTEKKDFSSINTLLFTIYLNYYDYDIIFEIMQEKKSILYQIITSQRSETNWFNLLSIVKYDFLEKLKEFYWAPPDLNELNMIISANKDKTQSISSYKNPYSNIISSISNEFDNNEVLYKKNENIFFKEVLNQKELSQESSTKIHEELKITKFSLLNSIEFTEEKMHWSHFLSSILVKMSDASTFDPKSYYLSSKSFPFKCPQLYSPSIFQSKEEVEALFNENFTFNKKNSRVQLGLFVKSENLPKNLLAVDCQICRYNLEIPSIMFLWESGICFLTYSKIATATEIQLLDKQNYDFISSVLLGQWGTTSIFSSHVIIKLTLEEIIYIQYINHNGFNIWSLKHGQFFVKVESNRFKKIKYPLSLLSGKILDNISPYQFLFKIDDLPSAIKKWRKYQISTDDLLLYSNGFIKKSFIRIKQYPYFPFIFESENMSLEDIESNSSINSINSNKCTYNSNEMISSSYPIYDRKKYSIPSSTNETAELLKYILPFSAISKYDALQIDLSNADFSKKESATELVNSTSFDNDSNTDSDFVALSDVKTNDLSVPNTENNTVIITDSSKSNNDLQLESMGSESSEMSSSSKGFFSQFFKKKSKDETQTNKANSAAISPTDESRINRTKVISFSSANQLSSTQVALGAPQKRMKRFSDVPSNFYRRANQRRPSILEDRRKASQSDLETVIKAFANLNKDCEQSSGIRRQSGLNLSLDQDSFEHDEFNPYLNVCPAHYFYVPELIKGFSSTPFYCVQKRREQLEAPANSQFITDWLIQFVINDNSTTKMKRISSQRAEQYNLISTIFSFDLIHVFQRLRKSCKPSKTFMFTTDNKLKRIKRLSMNFCGGLYAVIDKKDVSLSIVDLSGNSKKKSSTILCVHDKFFAHSKSIYVSNNGMFISVDYEFGVTKVYRILYSKGIPSNIVLISNFSSNMSPLSVIDGNKWICATASLSQLVLWSIFDGTIHRVLNFEGNITSISIDEECGIWVATEGRGFFISINGDILAEMNFKEEISQIKTISIHSSKLDRAAACGTKSGKVFLLLPRTDTKQIDVKQLKGGHSHQITQIIVHPNFKMLITVDSKNNSVIWTAKGLKSDPLNISMFEKCPFCNRNPEANCASCNRAVCKKCLINGLCQICYSLN